MKVYLQYKDNKKVELGRLEGIEWTEKPDFAGLNYKPIKIGTIKKIQEKDNE